MHTKILVLLVLSSVLLFGAEEKMPEKKIEIRVVCYAQSDSSKKENRLLVVGQTAYRSVEELKNFIATFPKRSEVQFVVYGTCDASDPRLTSEELSEIKASCIKAGVQFTYFPGG